MRTRFLRGTTQENNGLTLGVGELSIDTEKNALRLHDGATTGGFEMVGTRAYESISPGPTGLIGGDTTAGFYGEVPAADFITGGDLSAALGLSAGTLHNDTTPWLKFTLDGKTLFMPKKTIRYGLGWEAIYQAGAVYGDDTDGLSPSGTPTSQNAKVNIGGLEYRVRLIRGAGSDPTTNGDAGWDLSYTHGSEWNRLFYPIHSGVHSRSENPNPHTDPNTAPFGSWANYTDADLLLESSTDPGRRNWCMETTPVNEKVVRGYIGVTHVIDYSPTNPHQVEGWRPVLELVV